jgi:hypothetical protein
VFRQDKTKFWEPGSGPQTAPRFQFKQVTQTSEEYAVMAHVNFGVAKV